MNELMGKRVLIVEDNVSNMAVYAVAFKRSGAQVFQDPFNTDTIKLIRNRLPLDIVLLDLNLRYNLTGYDIFDKLKADPELADIPVLAVSASEPAVEIPKARARGFVGFIGKPIDPFMLVAQTKACIEGEQVWYTREYIPGGLK